jgi:uncharacterized membrane protein YeaQ/YmgE (transglycosylase-associated protein family)
MDAILDAIGRFASGSRRFVIAYDEDIQPTELGCRKRDRPSKGGFMVDFLVMIVLGLIVGAIAKFIMPGDDPGGIIVTILIGIVGAIVGGFIGRVLGLYQPGEAAGFIMSVVGALVLLFAYRTFTRSRA